MNSVDNGDYSDTKRGVKREIDCDIDVTEQEQKQKKFCKNACDILEEIDDTLFPKNEPDDITRIVNSNLPEKKAIKEIAVKLTEINAKSSPSMTKIFEKCNPLEREFKKKIPALFRSMVYRTFDMSKDFYDVDDGFIVFEDIFKVKIYISKQNNAVDIEGYFQLMESGMSHENIMLTLEKDKKTKKEFSIYIGFPFFITIKIDSQGGFTYFRKQFDSQLNGDCNVDSILYNGTSTTYQCLDIILANNFIGQLTYRKFSRGIDCLMTLIKLLQTYKVYGHTAPYNKNKIYFEEFYSIYKTARINVSGIPAKTGC